MLSRPRRSTMSPGRVKTAPTRRQDSSSMTQGGSQIPFGGVLEQSKRRGYSQDISKTPRDGLELASILGSIFGSISGRILERVWEVREVKMRPRRPQMAPRRRKTTPRATTARWRQHVVRCPKTGPRQPKTARDCPRCPQDVQHGTARAASERVQRATRVERCRCL